MADIEEEEELASGAAIVCGRRDSDGRLLECADAEESIACLLACASADELGRDSRDTEDAAEPTRVGATEEDEDDDAEVSSTITVGKEESALSSPRSFSCRDSAAAA